MCGLTAAILRSTGQPNNSVLYGGNERTHIQWFWRGYLSPRGLRFVHVLGEVHLDVERRGRISLAMLDDEIAAVAAVTHVIIEGFPRVFCLRFAQRLELLRGLREPRWADLSPVSSRHG